MLRVVTSIIIAGVLCLAFYLYQLKYETRQMQKELVLLSRQIKQDKKDIAVLRAELSILTDPSRLERLAIARGMVRMKPSQILSEDALAKLPFKEAKGAAQNHASTGSKAIKDLIAGVLDKDMNDPSVLEKGAER